MRAAGVECTLQSALEPDVRTTRQFTRITVKQVRIENGVADREVGEVGTAADPATETPERESAAERDST